MTVCRNLRSGCGVHIQVFRMSMCEEDFSDLSIYTLFRLSNNNLVKISVTLNMGIGSIFNDENHR